MFLKRYSKDLLRHKWFVFVECVKAGIPILGLLHDWTKFLPSEFIAYANFDFYSKTDTSDDAFDYAWLLHQKRNKHHWQWWILPEDNGGLKILDMPLKYRKEMLCDWKGAGRAYETPDTKKWWEANNHKMQLHPNTRQWLVERLEV